MKYHEIPGVLMLKTDALHGKRVHWKKDEKGEEYGGQLALLRLLQLVRKMLSQ